MGIKAAYNVLPLTGGPWGGGTTKRAPLCLEGTAGSWELAAPRAGPQELAAPWAAEGKRDVLWPGGQWDIRRRHVETNSQFPSKLAGSSRPWRTPQNCTPVFAL